MKRTKKDLLQNVKNVKSAKFINNNTLKIEYLNGISAIRLHDTDIITFAGKNIILNSGGWRTRTTKERINQYTPVTINQNKGLWYIKDKLFYDGCKVNQSGEMISKTIKINENKLNQLKKQIKKYCDLVTKDNLPLPESGDCWLCLFRDTKTGKAWGENDNSHLLSHLKEKYLHGSILVNAMREKGYNDNSIGLHYQMKLTDTFKRALRRYLQKRLLTDIAIK